MKRASGIFLVVCGSIVMLWTLLWLASYFIGRGMSAGGFSASLGHELFFWLPVCIFLIPGFLLIQHGRRLLDQQRLPSLAIGEVAILFAIIGITLAMMLPMDNFSFTAARIIANGIDSAKPLQAAIEEHYAQHDRFPGPAENLGPALPALEPAPHIHAMTLADGGRIVITFDTQDIRWGWSWWHYLLFRQPNDLTGLTLVLVPSVTDGTIRWDECSEGTVPRRNRHFKCSGHQ